MNTASNISIDMLKNHPDTIPSLAKIWQELIGKIWAPEISLNDIRHRFQQHTNDNCLPLTIAAFHAAQPVGMCSLRDNDGIHTDLKPWLGSLVVHPAYQNRGIGKMLIDSIKQKAQDLGFTTLYLFAHDKLTADYYIRAGWKIIEKTEFEHNEVIVMKIAF